MDGPQQPPSIFGGETHRLAGLTDGVFAIAMTLMAIELTLPKEKPVPDLAEAFLHLWPGFLAYAISFGLLGIYWSGHHSMFRFIQRTSHELVWLNIVFLAFVSLVPFSTGVLATHYKEPLAMAVYGGTLVALGLSLLPMWLHATRGRRLAAPDLSPNVVRYAVSRILVGVAGYGLATCVGLLSPVAGLVLFACVPLLYILPPIQVFWWRRFSLSHLPEAKQPVPE